MNSLCNLYFFRFVKRQMYGNAFEFLISYSLKSLQLRNLDEKLSFSRFFFDLNQSLKKKMELKTLQLIVN